MKIYTITHINEHNEFVIKSFNAETEYSAALNYVKNNHNDNCMVTKHYIDENGKVISKIITPFTMI